MKSITNKISLLSVLVIFMLSLGACSSTSLVNRWNDPEFKGPPLQKILIVGIIKDDIKRRAFEQEFARLISSNERTGIASYTLMPDLKSNGQKEDIIAIVDKEGADGVMVVTLQGVSKEQRDVPPSIDYVPTMGFGYGMYGYYGMHHSSVYRPGYTVTDTVVRLDAKLFAASSQKMIWAGKTESFNPTSSLSVVSELEKLIISDMKKSGIVK